jgi:hypothetical protein
MGDADPSLVTNKLEESMPVIKEVSAKLKDAVIVLLY